MFIVWVEMSSSKSVKVQDSENPEWIVIQQKSPKPKKSVPEKTVSFQQAQPKPSERKKPVTAVSEVVAVTVEKKEIPIDSKIFEKRTPPRWSQSEVWFEYQTVRRDTPQKLELSGRLIRHLYQYDSRSRDSIDYYMVTRVLDTLISNREYMHWNPESLNVFHAETARMFEILIQERWIEKSLQKPRGSLQEENPEKGSLKNLRGVVLHPRRIEIPYRYMGICRIDRKPNAKCPCRNGYVVPVQSRATLSENPTTFQKCDSVQELWSLLHKGNWSGCLWVTEPKTFQTQDFSKLRDLYCETIQQMYKTRPSKTPLYLPMFAVTTFATAEPVLYIPEAYRAGHLEPDWCWRQKKFVPYNEDSSKDSKDLKDTKEAPVEYEEPRGTTCFIFSQGKIISSSFAVSDFEEWTTRDWAIHSMFNTTEMGCDLPWCDNEIVYPGWTGHD